MGVTVGQYARKTFVVGNTFEGVDQPLLDWGLRTFFLNNTHRHQSRVSWNLLPRRIVQGSSTLINRRRSGRIRMLRPFTRDIDDAGRYLMSRMLVKGRFG